MFGLTAYCVSRVEFMHLADTFVDLVKESMVKVIGDWRGADGSRWSD